MIALHTILDIASMICFIIGAFWIWLQQHMINELKEKLKGDEA